MSNILVPLAYVPEKDMLITDPLVAEKTFITFITY